MLKREDEPVFSVNNRGFLFGDGFFETMFAFNNEIPFLNLHMERLNKAIRILELIPHDLLSDYIELKSLITYLARKNKLYKGYRVRLTVFRNHGGLYTPADNSVSFIIQTKPLNYSNYTFNEEGLIIDSVAKYTKDYSRISQFKTLNSLPYVLAANYAKQNQLDDVLLLNSKGFIVESTNSNVFFIANNELYTPKIKDGCIAGIMRNIIIRMLEEEGVVVHQQSLHPNIVNEAEEIFLTNSISGIRYVTIYKQKRFLNFYTRKIHQLFLKKIKYFGAGL